MPMGRSAPRILVLLLMAVLSVGLLAACGDDDEGGEATEATTAATTTAPPAGTTGTAEEPAGEATVLEIPAHETDLAYQVTEATAPAGEVTLRMPNPSALPHNIAVDEPTQAIGEVVEMGGVSEITVDFPSGEYEYYCTVPGHREAGMVGTLTVE